LRVSTSPAAFTAVTRVDSTGLLLAAVATGSAAIPVKLPGPLVGTALHADPKSAAGAAESLVGADSAEVVAGAADGELDPLLVPQADRVVAAATMASAATIFWIRMNVPLEG
jgi:hypothetical protein